MDSEYQNLDTEPIDIAELAQDPPRLTSAQVQERILNEGAKLVETRGLAVSIDYLVMDELVEAAGVARSTVRRIWPRNQDFLAELFVRLIDPDDSRGEAFDTRTLELASEVIERYRDDLLTPDGRVAVLREAIRLAVKHNFEALKHSLYWRSYITLSLALPTFEDADRKRVIAALHRVDRRFFARSADFYNLMLAHFVRRPRPGITVGQIAAEGIAVIEGLALRANINPSFVGKSIRLPGIDGKDVDWHLAAVGFLGIIQAMTEPVSGDPIEYALLPLPTEVPT